VLHRPQHAVHQLGVVIEFLFVWLLEVRVRGVLRTCVETVEPAPTRRHAG
jgi:hypothetical protein